MTRTTIPVFASLRVIGGLTATQACAESDDGFRGASFVMTNAATDNQISRDIISTLNKGVGIFGIFSIQEDGGLEDLGSKQVLLAKAGLNGIATF